MSANYPVSQPADGDRYRRVVVLLLWSVHPMALATDEVEREVGEDRSFASRDAVDEALRDLAAAGVVHRREGFVTLTRAAVVTAGLLESW